MTRSSNKELLTPFENPKRVLRSTWKLFKTPSLVESDSPEFNQFSNIEEHIKEEETEIMAETIKQYMSKTYGEYRSGIARPRLIRKPLAQKQKEVLKTKFLSKYCPLTCIAKKIEEIKNFQQEPDESLFRAWEIFKELLMKYPQHYLTNMQEVILFYNGLDVPTRQILDSNGAILTKTAADAKVAIQEMAEYSQKWHIGTSSRNRSTKTLDAMAAIQA
nr:hypothetical protein [Tanacetum cinerariifolium]